VVGLVARFQRQKVNYDDKFRYSSLTEGRLSSCEAGCRESVVSLVAGFQRQKVNYDDE
jgi:hypothetical protein